VHLPPFPKAENLVAFEAGAAVRFRFAVDASSLAPGRDGVVRYILVATSPTGARNISFEGIRCRTGTFRVYALGRDDGTWSERPGEWRPIVDRRAQPARHALWRDYFCPHRVPIAEAREGVAALRQGGHPHAPRADTPLR